MKPMALKRKGVISKKSGGTLQGRMATGLVNSIPVLGGAIAPLVEQLMSSGMSASQAMSVAGGRRKKKGLTYNEIRGAVKVLKLVKKFAPAGHRTALRVRRARTSRVY